MIAPRRSRNSALTTQGILSAARTLFAEHGFAGTTLQQVEVLSGISKGLILHHFATKEALYQAVLNGAMEEYAGWLKKSVSFQADFPALMKDTIRAAYRYFREHDDLRRLRSWSLLQGNTPANPAEIQFTRALIKAIEDAQLAGIVRADISAVEIPLLIRAAIDYRLNNLGLVRQLELENGIDEKQSDETFVETLARLFLQSRETLP